MAGVLHAFMNARYLDPVRGQFITEDPLVVGQDKGTLDDRQALNAYSQRLRLASKFL